MATSKISSTEGLISTPRQQRVLRGVRVLSLALNLPGPAALMRLQAMGAHCTKLEPPAPPGATSTSGDPMAHYRPKAYQTMHQGVRTVQADLKTAPGQGGRCGAAVDQVVQLGVLHFLSERTVVGKAVHQVGQPPRKTLRAPNAGQAAI